MIGLLANNKTLTMLTLITGRVQRKVNVFALFVCSQVASGPGCASLLGVPPVPVWPCIVVLCMILFWEVQSSFDQALLIHEVKTLDFRS